MNNSTTPSALEFISKWDYKNGSNLDKENFEKEAEEIQHTLKMVDLKAAFQRLQIVVCSSEFPVQKEGPAINLVSAALNWLLDKTRELDRFQDEYAGFFLACISAGPSFAQIKVMQKILNEGLTNYYTQKLQGDKLKEYLEGLQKKFIHYGNSREDYCKELSSVITPIIKSFTDDQCQCHREVFVRLLMFYQSQIPGSDEHMATMYYYDLVCSLQDLLGDEPWHQKLEDLSSNPTPFCFREQMKAFQDVAKTGEYPAYDTQGKIFASVLENILEPMRQNETYFNVFLDDVMQLFCTLAKLPPGEAQQMLMEPFHSFFYSLADARDLLQGKPELFVEYTPVFRRLIGEIPHPDCMGMLINSLVENFLIPVSGDSDNSEEWISVLVACLTHPDVRYIKLSQIVLTKYKHIFQWKDNVDGAGLLLTTIGTVKLLTGMGETTESYLNPREVGEAQRDLVKKLTQNLEDHDILEEVQKDIQALLQKILEEGREYQFVVAAECAQYAVNTKEMRVLENFSQREDYTWHDCRFKDIFPCVRNQHQFSDYSSLFAAMLKTATNGCFCTEESNEKLLFQEVVSITIDAFADVRWNKKSVDDLKPFLDDITRLLRCDEEKISKIALGFVSTLSDIKPAIFASHINHILEAISEKDDRDLLSIVETCYRKNPKPVDDQFDMIFRHLDPPDELSWLQSYVFRILKEIAQHSPKLFTKKYVDKLLGNYLHDSENAVLELLESLANACPAIVEPHIDLLFGYIDTLYGSYAVPNICLSILNENKDLTTSLVKRLVEFLETCDEHYNYLTNCLNVMRLIGLKDRNVLQPHKHVFQRIGDKHQWLKDLCKNIIDIINERSYEDVTTKVEQQEDDITELGSRVTKTEDDVNEITEAVESQGKQVGQLKEDVAKQEERIDELEEVVDDTVEKVDEIDKKSLTNAPAWSRDVSILLNPEAEHDWRLLAQRLGYTPEDIRGWATQHDPCMSLLSEWFATHKTSEATNAVLKTLEEMNRLDAAEIVGRAMKAVENVVQDEPHDYDAPPPIFISYQWAHQPEVRLFRKHLEMAGFESWMDIGQMGGGDKLYAKLDQGIRAAQVVICCVTEKYAKSPNCNREVNLAVNLRKPMIPLLLENVAWPPAGGMGPIFGEYLYIRFFQSGPANDSQNERYWPASSFQELLMQLSFMKLIPEQSKIKTPYKNWWLPPEEIIVVKKKVPGGDKQTAIVKSAEKKESGPQPEVFISYQWGMQPQVKALYKRMCGLGYHCWMDIHQMGGGDSLYDKIDRGVRGSKVVLSCVTEKYSKSANCRREVSLADALKKPIIPLLLEDTAWPPSGPMSMVFTQLLYIDFKDEKVQKSWSGSSFDELVGKIETHLSGDSAES